MLHGEKTPFTWVPLPGSAEEQSDVPSAGGQWAEAWEPRSGSALAETERLSASERPSKVRNRRTGPRGCGLDQKVSGSTGAAAPFRPAGVDGGSLKGWQKISKLAAGNSRFMLALALPSSDRSATFFASSRLPFSSLVIPAQARRLSSSPPGRSGASTPPRNAPSITASARLGRTRQ